MIKGADGRLFKNVKEWCEDTKIITNRIKLKDLKPKYKMLELIEDDGENFHFIPLINYKDACKKYGHRKVLSIRVYEDTKTTSVIIESEKH